MTNTPSIGSASITRNQRKNQKDTSILTQDTFSNLLSSPNANRFNFEKDFVLQRNNEVIAARSKVLDSMVPYYRYRIGTDLQIKGQRIPFSDLTDFIHVDNLFGPVFSFCCDEKDFEDSRKSPKRIDMTPFICVGLCELLAVEIMKENDLDSFNDEINRLFQDVSCTVHDYKQIREFLFNETGDESKDRCNPLTIPLSMTSSYVDYRYEWIREYSAKLFVISLVSQKDFVTILLKCFERLYLTTMPFYLGLYGDSKSKDRYGFMSCLYRSLTDRGLTFKKIGYTADDKKHYISDCRGISIYSASILIFGFNELFAEKRNTFKHGMSAFLKSSNTNTKQKETDTDEPDDESTEHPIRRTGEGLFGLTQVLLKCIGDDFIGRYLKNGRFRLRNTSIEHFYYSYGHLRMTNTGSSTINGILREQYENEIVFRKAFEVQNTTHYDKLCKDDTCIHYFTMPYLMAALESLVNVDEFVSMDAYERLGRTKDAEIRQLMNENARLAKNNRSSEMDIDFTSTDTYHKMNDQIEAQAKRIKELEYQLVRKTTMTESLTTELNDMKTRFQNMFLEDTADESLLETDNGLTEDVSIEDMVDYLNNFRLIMIGGRPDLAVRMKELGWDNFMQLDRENTNMVTGKADFFCINTKFTAHKVVRLVESSYSAQKDQIFYYNGTNVIGLLRVCYKFVKNWVESETIIKEA
mgnify:CR=1 FL=1